METYEGYVEKITYRNEENGYTVLTIKDGGKELTCIGTFPAVSEGEYLVLEGEMTVHSLYGEQLKVTQYDFRAPSDERAIERYLGSGAIRGIGEKMARRIVDMFGRDTIRILEEEPEVLSKVKGISERMAMDFALQVIEKRELRSAVLFLQQFGVSLNNAAKIYRKYGSDLYRIVREDPYRLADDITGIGFKTADDIALSAGFSRDSEFRIRSGIQYTLMRATENGHTCLPKEILFRETENILETEIADFESLLFDLLTEKKIQMKRVEGEERIWLSRYYRMESQTALMLSELNIHDSTISAEDTEKKLFKIEKEEGIELDTLQHQALIEAAMNGITILTGGPGTGKTTIINMMIRYFLDEGLDILLAAPTGRAAKRMTEATGYEAQTIHRLLEMTGDPEGHARFQRNEDSPLEADVIIIDEMSMVDISLMHALLKALVPGMRLILVGDVDQLPSVGCGNVLRDLIRSDVFPCVRLNRIFRQSEDSDIVLNAHKINEGEMIEPRPSKDFLFILRDDAASITGASITLLTKKLPDYVKAETSRLQVLTPMRKGVLGVENLNRILQARLNPPSEKKAEKAMSWGVFREGDKVMQIRNDYQLEWVVPGSFPETRGVGVFNGDSGIIRFISSFDETLTVEFDDRRIVVYPFSALDELELSYAVTIHKSQGSEYPAVILPLLSGPRMLMNRNLLYTAVTRAKSCVCVVGKLETFRQMILNNEEVKRYSGLCDMLRELYEPA